MSDPQVGRATRRVSALVGFAVAVTVARLVVDLLVGSSWTLLPGWLLPLDYLAAPVTVLVGVTLSRLPTAEARASRLMVAAGTIVAIAAALFTLAHLSLAATADLYPGARGTAAALATLSNGLFPFVYTWPALLALVYPLGRFGSRAAARTFALLLAADVVVAVVDVVSAAAAPPPYDAVANPLLVPAARGDVGTTVFAVGLLGMLVGMIGAVVLCARRLRSARGRTRLQLVWFGTALLLTPAALVSCVLAVVVPVVDPVVSLVLIDLGQLGVAGAVAVASGPTLRRASAALADAVDAGLLAPLRSRRRTPDRGGPGSVDGPDLVRAFARRLHDGGDTADRIEQCLRAALSDPGLRVWVVDGVARWSVDGEAGAADRDDRDDRVRTSVTFAGATVAAIEHRPELEYRPLLLAGCLREAAPTLALLRLQLALRRQVVEIDRSRQRIAEAGVQERRRLERDLHDGAQQRLVVLGVSLRRIQRSLPGGAQVLAPALNAAVDQVSAAIVDLRSLAAGIRPVRLDAGLRDALHDMAAASPIPVHVEMTAERFADTVEDLSYFVACEAITNAIKHAGPCRVDVRGERVDGGLRMVVTDTGRGGATPSAGRGGLLGMQDRAAAHGGRLAIVSPPGGGTTVELTVPVSQSPTGAVG